MGGFKVKQKLIAAGAASLMAFGVLSATADEAAANADKVLFENDRVRVVEATYAPGTTHEMHSHPDHVVYALGDAKVRMTGEDGKSTDVEIKKGGTRWQPAVTHKTENVGTTPLHAILVELKEPAK
jgi:quercetin dioxygenase-like cupin family protein